MIVGSSPTSNAQNKVQKRMNTLPHRYNVGDKIIVTIECMERMRWHARQAAHPGIPSDSFLWSIQEMVGIPGEVVHTHPPGYEITAKFGDRYFHMKDNWVRPIT